MNLWHFQKHAVGVEAVKVTQIERTWMSSESSMSGQVSFEYGSRWMVCVHRFQSVCQLFIYQTAHLKFIMIYIQLSTYKFLMWSILLKGHTCYAHPSVCKVQIHLHTHTCLTLKHVETPSLKELLWTIVAYPIVWHEAVLLCNKAAPYWPEASAHLFFQAGSVYDMMRNRT